MPKRKKPSKRKQKKPNTPDDLRKAAEAVLRYRAQPGMRSKRFINPC